MFGPYNAMQDLVFSLVCIHLTEEGRTNGFTLSSWCPVIVSIMWLFLTVPCVGVLCVIVVFPGHTHLLFCFVKFHSVLSRNV